MYSSLCSVPTAGVALIMNPQMNSTWGVLKTPLVLGAAAEVVKKAQGLFGSWEQNRTSGACGVVPPHKCTVCAEPCCGPSGGDDVLYLKLPRRAPNLQALNP